MAGAGDDAAVELFCELLRHKTVSLEGPAGAYTECADFIQAWCERIGLSTQRVSLVEGKPIVVATWVGEEPDLPTVLLNSHYDVVPCEDDNWHMCAGPLPAASL
jgi:aminoacylase